MTMPTNQYPWRMQVHHITQETPDVWTISLICHSYYPYRAEQYALVSMRNLAEALRTYTVSSTPGVGEYITLTAWRINDDVGPRWLTHDVKRGDYLWLSDVMGEFTYDDKAEDKFLLLAAGCGVIPIMSMRRWLAKNRSQADVQVIYNMCTLQDMIFANEQRNYPVVLVAGNNITGDFIAGRLTHELLTRVPDLASRTVMTCGPAPYMDWVEQGVKTLDVMRFFKEKFFTPVAEAATNGLKFIGLWPVREFYTLVDTTLLEALESSNVPAVAAYYAGVCGCYRTKVISGEYVVSSTMTLTDTEIAEDYVLVCSCHLQGDLILTQPPDARWYSFHQAI